MQDYFSKWDQEGTVDFGKTFSELIILTASRTLMGAPRCILLPCILLKSGSTAPTKIAVTHHLQRTMRCTLNWSHTSAHP